ncbi:nuclear receptor-interacting protein 2-like isoform X2 [Myxocyprinus asiaticus]|uniref:nuclear receptor-interacting protein 2-like isoform X2 n=1 Tax=Myxocyprinus asiaticus TaxID=70543 RepID=UPI0022238F0C|nr:nuclear receptor-interacting protein 2-like isoform X2 [Myxocyprinus asiaticus]
MSEGKKELEMRDKAIMHQQRRLKQATQFSHKDSADLLPLDGLKRMGTSKDLQPHSIVQRRLLEGNIPRLRGEARDAPTHVRSPLADSKEGGEPEERSESTVDDSTEERESPEESEKSFRSDEDEDDEDGDSSDAGGKTEPKQKGGRDQTEVERKKGLKEGGKASTLSAIMVQCKCGDAEVMLSINTGCQHNHISKTCCRRLGLKTTEDDKSSGKLPVSDSTMKTVQSLHLQLGRDRVQCTAQRTTRLRCVWAYRLCWNSNAVWISTPECSVFTAQRKSFPSWIHHFAASAITMTTTKTCDLRPLCPTTAMTVPM